MNISDLKILMQKKFDIEKKKFFFEVNDFKKIPSWTKSFQHISEFNEFEIINVNAMEIDEEFVFFSGEAHLSKLGEVSDIKLYFWEDQKELETCLIVTKKICINNKKLSDDYPVLRDSIFDSFYVSDEMRYIFSTKKCYSEYLNIDLNEGLEFSTTFIPDDVEFEKIDFLYEMSRSLRNDKLVRASGTLCGDKEQPEFDLGFDLSDVELSLFKNIKLLPRVSLQSYFYEIPREINELDSIKCHAFIMDFDLNAKINEKKSIHICCQFDIKNLNQLHFRSDFTNIDINITELSSWLNGEVDVLKNLLPNSHQNDLRLKLLSMNFTVNNRRDGISLGSISFDVGLAGIGDIIPDYLSVDNLEGSLFVFNPFSKETFRSSSNLAVDMTLFKGRESEFSLQGEMGYQDGMSVIGHIPEGSKIDIELLLKEIFNVKYHGPSLPVFDELFFRSENMDKSLSWQIGVGSDDGFEIFIAEKKLKFESLSIDIQYLNSQFSCLLVAYVDILDASKALIKCDLSEGFELFSNIKKDYYLAPLIKNYTNLDCLNLGWIDDISLTNPSVNISKKEEQYSLKISSTISYKSIDTNFAVVIEKYDDEGNLKSGYVFGLLFKKINIGEILPKISESLKDITIVNAGLVSSSVSIKNYKLNDLFPDVDIDVQNYGLDRGVLLFSEIDFEETKFNKLGHFLRGENQKTDSDCQFLTRLLLKEKNEFEFDLIIKKKFDIFPGLISIVNPSAVFEFGDNWSIKLSAESGYVCITKDTILSFSLDLSINKSDVKFEIDLTDDFQIPGTNVDLKNIRIICDYKDAAFSITLAGAILLESSHSNEPNEIDMMLVIKNGVVSGFCGCYDAGKAGTTLSSLIRSFVDTKKSNINNSIFDEIKIYDFMIAVVIDDSMDKNLISNCNFKEVKKDYKRGLYLRVHTKIHGIEFDIDQLNVTVDGILVKIAITNFEVLKLSIYDATIDICTFKIKHDSPHVRIESKAAYAIKKIAFINVDDAKINLDSNGFEFSVDFVIYKKCTVSLDISFSNTLFKIYFSGDITFKTKWGGKITVGAGVDLQIKKTSWHAKAWVEAPWGNVYIINLHSTLYDEYLLATEEVPDDEYLDIIEEKFYEKAELALKDMNVSSFVELCVGENKIFDIDIASVSAKMIHTLVNGPCDEAANAVLEIHNDRVIGPAHLAQDLYHCDHDAYEHEPYNNIYSPSEIIPVLDKIMPEKMDAVVGGKILCDQLRSKENPEHGAKILYDEGGLYPLDDKDPHYKEGMKTIYQALIHKEAFAISKAQAREIIKNIRTHSL